MECIIIAGGLGSRLQAAVSDVPKCMAPVGGRPFLYYVFKYLEQFKIDHVILSLGYKHEIVLEWINQNSWSFLISYTVEKEPLGTGGAIKAALQFAKEPNVMIMNGDTFFNIDIPMFYEDHYKKATDITIALKPLTDFNRYGNVKINEKKCIISFQEKQFCAKGLINGGIYILRRESKMMNKLEGTFSFETEVLQNQVNSGFMNGFISDGYFIDIGIPEDYEKANTDFKMLFNES